MTDKELLFKISGGIKRLRIEKGFKSYMTFAKVAGMHHNQYYRMECGENMTLKTLNKVLNAHNLTFKQFSEQELKQ